MCGPAGFTLQIWMQEWDAHIQQWIQTDGAHDLGAPELLAAYRAAAGADWQGDALPEPYVGAPMGALSCVVMTHNPGGALPPQRLPAGALVTGVAAASYSARATTWDLAVHQAHEQGGTMGWWRSLRARSLRRTLGYPVATPQLPSEILGIDLVPWHSEAWHAIGFGTPAIDEYVRCRVLAPACHAARTATVRFGGPAGQPLAFGFGAHYRDFLAGRQDFERVYHVDQERAEVGHQGARPHRGTVAGIPWPKNKAGGPSTRFFSLYRRTADCAEGVRLHVLVISANVGKPWGADFDPIVGALVAGGMP